MPKGFAPVAAIVGVVVVGALAAGSFYVYKNLDIVQNILNKEVKLTPEETTELLFAAVEEIRSADTLHQEQSLDVVAEFEAGSSNPLNSMGATLLAQRDIFEDQAGVRPSRKTTITINASGVSDFDKSDAENTKMANDIRATVDYEAGDTTVTFSLDVETKYLDNKLYIKPNKIPTQALFFLSGVEELLGKWLVVDAEKAQDSSLRGVGGFGVAGEGVDQDEIIAEYKERASRTVTIAKETYSQHPFLTMVRMPESQQMEGESAQFYTYEVHTNILADFVPAFMTVATDVYGEDFDDSDYSREDIVGALRSATGTMWIGEETGRVYRHDLAISLSAESGSANGIVSGVFSGYNDPVDISAPEDAIDLIEHMEEQFSRSFGSSMDTGKPPVQTLDPSSDEDEDGLTFFVERSLCTDPNNSDTDGDGYSDGSEVENGYNPNGEGTLDEYVPNCPDWADVHDAGSMSGTLEFDMEN